MSGNVSAIRLGAGIILVGHSLVLLAACKHAAPDEYTKCSRDANQARIRGDLHKAISLYEEALLCGRRRNEPLAVVQATYNLAICEMQAGNLQAAENRLTEARLELGSLGEEVRPREESKIETVRCKLLHLEGKNASAYYGANALLGQYGGHEFRDVRLALFLLLAETTDDCSEAERHLGEAKALENKGAPAEGRAVEAAALRLGHRRAVASAVDAARQEECGAAYLAAATEYIRAAQLASAMPCTNRRVPALLARAELCIETVPGDGHSSDMSALLAELKRRVWERYEQGMQSLAFSPDGRRIIAVLTGGRGQKHNTASLWDAETGRRMYRLSDSRGAVGRSSFSPDGHLIVAASGERTARVWDAGTGDCMLVLRGHQHAVVSASFSPDGRRIVTASLDGTAKVWDVSTGVVVHTLGDHESPVQSARFCADGKCILTISRDELVPKLGTARVWNPETGEEPRVVHGLTEEWGIPVFSPGGNRVVTASGELREGTDGAARMWDVTTGKVLHVLRGDGNYMQDATFSPDGRRVATISENDAVWVWDAHTGRMLQRLLGHSGDVLSARFSPDGDHIVTTSCDQTARLWEVETGRLPLVLGGHKGAVTCAAFSPDGKRVATASRDGTACVWDAETGERLHILSN